MLCDLFRVGSKNCCAFACFCNPFVRSRVRIPVGEIKRKSAVMKMQSAVGSNHSNGSSVTVSSLSQANTNANAALTEHDYIGLSEVSSSSSSDYVQHQQAGSAMGDAELNLGLSLSYDKENDGIKKDNVSRRGFEQWVSQERGRARILTAQDLHDMDIDTGARYGSSSSTRAPAAPASIMMSMGMTMGSGGSRRGSNELDEPRVLDDSSGTQREQAVGWPPVGSFRRRSKLSINSRPSQEECAGVQQTSKPVQKQGTSLYVKVNMDGVPIGRKVDLRVHDSYESLALALEEMFQRPTNVNGQNGGQFAIQRVHGIANEPKRPRLLDSSSDFVLTYEDKEGDWMLVGDVPWRMFVNTVKRLRIMKTTDANGLGPRCPEKMIGQKSKPV